MQVGDVGHTSPGKFEDRALPTLAASPDAHRPPPRWLLHASPSPPEARHLGLADQQAHGGVGHAGGAVQDAQAPARAEAGGAA